MTVTTEVSLVRFAGNDLTTVFPYAFQVDLAADLNVVLAVTTTGVETALVNGADYSVTGIGGTEAGGNVTYPLAGDPLATGETLTIYRDPDLLQAVDLQSQGPYFAETQETALDKLVRQIQALQDELNRTFKVSVSSGTVPATLTTFTDLWDGVNLFLNKNTYPGNSVTMDSSTGEYVFYKDSLEVFRLTAYGIPGEGLNATSYGVVGDGVTNDAAAIQAAIDAAETAGITQVVIPEGEFLLGATSLVLPEMVGLQGAGRNAVVDTGGTQLTYTGAGNAITIDGSWSVPAFDGRREISIRDLSINLADTAAAGIWCDFMTSGIIERVRIYGDAGTNPTYGIYFRNSYVLTINDVKITDCDTGIYATIDAADNVFSGQSIFTNVEVWDSDTYGVHITSSVNVLANIVFLRSHFKTNATGVFLEGTNIHSVDFFGCHFEQSSVTDINVDATVSRGPKLIGCFFNNQNTVYKIICNGDTMTARDCEFTGTSLGWGIYINGENNRIADNVFYNNVGGITIDTGAVDTYVGNNTITIISGDAIVDNGANTHYEGVFNEINYTTPADAASEFAALNIQMDVSSLDSTSEVHGVNIAAVGATSGRVTGIGTHSGVAPIHQHTGAFQTPDQTTPNAQAGRIPAISGTWADGLDGETVLLADDDEIYIGASTVFGDLEVILSTPASQDEFLVFEYQHTDLSWDAFVPLDGTTGFRQNGIIEWDSGSLTNWKSDSDPGGADTAAGYWIRIRRTRNTVITDPVVTTIKTLNPTEYEWDKDGNVNVLTFDASIINGDTFYASEYSTVQAAINAAEANGSGRVLVGAGTFNERLTIDSPGVILEGAGAGWTIIKETVESGHGLTITASCIVKNMAFSTTAGGGNLYNGIDIQASAVTLDGVSIKESDRRGINVGGSSALVRIINCSIGGIGGTIDDFAVSVNSTSTLVDIINTIVLGTISGTYSFFLQHDAGVVNACQAPTGSINAVRLDTASSEITISGCQLTGAISDAGTNNLVGADNNS